MESKDKLKQKLVYKLEQEYKDFCERMKQKTKEELIQSAYEIVVKEEIRDEIKNYTNLDSFKLKALIKHRDIIDEIYWQWKKEDSRLGEVLENSINETIEIIVEDYEKKKSEKDNESR